MSIQNGQISLPLGMQYTGGWLNREAIATTELRAFTIRRTELEFLLLQMTISQCDAARFYLGDKADKNNPKFQPCLIMVGVQGFVPGNEMAHKSDAGTVITPPSIPGTDKCFTYFPSNITMRPIYTDPLDAYVLDFAYPCPHTCNINDELFNPLPNDPPIGGN